MIWTAGCQALQELSLANLFNFMVHCVKMATIFQFSQYTSVTLFAMYFFGLFLSRGKVYFLSPWIQAGLLSCFDIYSAMEFCRGMVCQFWGLKGMAVSVLSGTLCSCQVGLAFWEMRDHKEQSSQLKCPTWGPRHLRGPGYLIHIQNSLHSSDPDILSIPKTHWICFFHRTFALLPGKLFPQISARWLSFCDSDLSLSVASSERTSLTILSNCTT